jgi:hypothetical protein
MNDFSVSILISKNMNISVENVETSRKMTDLILGGMMEDEFLTRLNDLPIEDFNAVVYLTLNQLMNYIQGLKEGMKNTQEQIQNQLKNLGFDLVIRKQN